MRSILIDGSNDPGFPARMASGLALARIFDGDVTVVIGTSVGAYVSTDAMVGSVLAVDALNQALERDDNRAAQLQAALEAEDVPSVVKRSEGEPLDTVMTAARLADLVILSRSSPLAGRIAASTSVPLLLLPDDRPLDIASIDACVAWDGSIGSSAALRAAVPLLTHCRQVGVVTVGDESSTAIPRDAADYLARQGVQAEAAMLNRDGSIARTLDKAIAARGAGLVVMGAFGHSRVRELLFGGVTRHFLEGEEQPALLLAH